MASFWSFPEFPKGPQSREALLVVPLFFVVVVVWLLVRWLAS